MVENRSQKAKYFLISTVKALAKGGIGKSKREMMQATYRANKTRESPYIHSNSTAVRYEKVIAKFGDFLRNEMGIKYERDFKELSADELYTCVDAFLEKEKASGLAQNTLEIHISALAKVLTAVNPEIREYFDSSNRARWRDGAPVGDNDRYSNSDRIIENLRKIDETSAAVAELQRLCGARVGDVKKIVLDEENKRVFISKSKGGRDRWVYFDKFEEQFERVKECKETLDKALQEKKFSEIRENEYYENLRKACRKSGEVYRGAHCFRYEYAQELYKEISRWDKEEQEAYYRRILEDRGKSDKEIEKAVESVKERDLIAEAVVSEELGHSRIDISMQYLKIRRK